MQEHGIENLRFYIVNQLARLKKFFLHMKQFYLELLSLTYQSLFPPDIRLHGRASSGSYNDAENDVATKGRKSIDSEVRPRRIDNTAQSMSSRGTSPNFLAQSKTAICIILLSALS